VVARTSAFAFKGKAQDVRKIARRSAPRTCSKAACVAPAIRMRITVQLIAAETGLHIWSKPTTSAMGDIFRSRTPYRARSPKHALTLSAQTAEVWAQRQPEKMEALELYLLGRGAPEPRAPPRTTRSRSNISARGGARSAIHSGADRPRRVAAQRFVAQPRTIEDVKAESSR
jgi:hypothetical protein